MGHLTGRQLRAAFQIVEIQADVVGSVQRLSHQLD